MFSVIENCFGTAAMNEQEFVAATLPDPFLNRGPSSSMVGSVRKRGDEKGSARGGRELNSTPDTEYGKLIS